MLWGLWWLLYTYLINNVPILGIDLCNGSKVPKDPKCFVELKV